MVFIQNVDRAGKAQQTGAFDKEITPVTTKVTDKDGNEHTVTVSVQLKYVYESSFRLSNILVCFYTLILNTL